MKLSIIIVSYNVKDYLRQCLRSIYRSNLDTISFEIIIIDNDSHDGTIKEIEKDFNKVIFWSAELFYSGFLRELSELFWLFYYDFYTFNVPFYKINSKFKKFKKLNQFEYLLDSFYILFQAEPTCDIFIIKVTIFMRCL